MAMSLKAELEAWASALQAYDAEDFQQALELFEPISDTSRILTNIGLILATVGEHERAVDHFKRATELDQYLAIAYFQGGVSSFLLANYEDAFEQFETALMWLRGNQAINYEQLGLNFRLYTAEILFNRGLCLLNMGRMDEGLQDLQAALKDKCTPEHDVIDDAIKENGDGYTVFSIPVGIVFRPNPNKIKNLQAKDYLGKARLISNDGGKYEAFDGVDPDQLAFRREKTISRPTRAGRTSDPGARPEITPAAEGANLGRSSSDLGGTSAPRNPAGLSRAATTAVTPSRPVEPRRQPEALTRAMTTVRPAQPLARSTSVRPAEPLARSATTVRPTAQPLARSGTTIRPARPQSPSQAPMSRSPEPIAGPGPIRGLSVRRPPGVLKPAAPPADTDELYDSYSAQPEVDEWVEATVPGASPTRAPSRSASALGGRSQASYPSRSPSQYAPRRALSRKGTMASRRTRSYDEEEGYVSGSGEYDEVPFEATKIRVRLHFNNDIRGMAILPDISCDEFQDKVCSKFGREYGDLSLKFADEDGARVTLIDDSDFELAIETARAAALKGKESRLEIWCEKV